MQHVITLHGLAERNPDYAAQFVNNLLSSGLASSEVDVIQVFYGDLLDPIERSLSAKLTANPKWHKEHMRPYRGFINEFIMDMTQWYFPQIRGQLVDRVYRAIGLDQRRSNSDSYHALLHSWGSVIMLSKNAGFPADFVNELASITTAGCALHLEDMGQCKINPMQHPNWTNFYHSDDVIGVPLNTVYGCDDVEITDSGPPTWMIGGEEIVLAGLAHNCYFGSKMVAEHVTAQIRARSINERV